MASAQQHVELALELHPDADRAAVEHWLRERGLDALPLVSGVLASGDSSAAREAFGVEPAGELPVPGDLRSHVKSVVVVPPKQPHGAL